MDLCRVVRVLWLLAFAWVVAPVSPLPGCVCVCVCGCGCGSRDIAQALECSGSTISLWLRGQHRLSGGRMQSVYNWLRKEAPAAVTPYLETIIAASQSITLTLPRSGIQPFPHLTGGVLLPVSLGDGTGEGEHLLVPVDAPRATMGRHLYDRVLMHNVNLALLEVSRMQRQCYPLARQGTSSSEQAGAGGYRCGECGLCVCYTTAPHCATLCCGLRFRCTRPQPFRTLLAPPCFLTCLCCGCCACCCSSFGGLVVVWWCGGVVVWCAMCVGCCASGGWVGAGTATTEGRVRSFMEDAPRPVLAAERQVPLLAVCTDVVIVEGQSRCFALCSFFMCVPHVYRMCGVCDVAGATAFHRHLTRCCCCCVGGVCTHTCRCSLGHNRRSCPELNSPPQESGGGTYQCGLCGGYVQFCAHRTMLGCTLFVVVTVVGPCLCACMYVCVCVCVCVQCSQCGPQPEILPGSWATSAT